VLGPGEAGGGTLCPHQLRPKKVGAALKLLAHLPAEPSHLNRKHGSLAAAV